MCCSWPEDTYVHKVGGGLHSYKSLEHSIVDKTITYCIEIGSLQTYYMYTIGRTHVLSYPLHNSKPTNHPKPLAAHRICSKHTHNPTFLSPPILASSTIFPRMCACVYVCMFIKPVRPPSAPTPSQPTEARRQREGRDHHRFPNLRKVLEPREAVGPKNQQRKTQKVSL